MTPNALSFADLEKPVSSLPLIGPATAKRLEKLELFTIEDLLLHAPHRYHDYSQIVKVTSARVGETITIQGTITQSIMLPTKSRVSLQKFTLTDPTGSLEITFFNQPYLLSSLKRGSEVSVAGTVESNRGKATLISPEFELIKATSLPRGEALRSYQLKVYPVLTGTGAKSSLIHTGRLIPHYPETKGISSKWLRSRLAPLLSQLPQTDQLPEALRHHHHLISWGEAIQALHYPESRTQAELARKRLSFDELLLLHLKSLLLKKSWARKRATTALPLTKEDLADFIKALPFTLTLAQRRVVREVSEDLAKTIPMNRLLEGDVGSGKTVIAAFALFAALVHKKLGVLMAPTQILAEQHTHTLSQFLQPFGAKISLVTAANKLKAKSLPRVLSSSKDLRGSKLKANVLVGTHALLHRPQLLAGAAVTIIDEQHRFGVSQRAALKNLKSIPHQLTMTATPIPRTVALTLYGNLDLSILDESPPGRILPKTWVVPRFKRAKAYQWIQRRIEKHHDQVFIVCPLIDTSEKESMLQVKAATAEFQSLKKIFPHLKLDLLHGRLPAPAKTAVITRFAQRKTHILVTTPVVEVGLDIPAASIMLIEAAERFGLSTLHQLRGRIGRRGQDSFCLLFPSHNVPPTTRRLRLLETETSGLKLAEADLTLRGPGELFGVSQSGFFSLKIASLTDTTLIKETKVTAEILMRGSPTLKKYPLLKQKLKRLVATNIVPN